MLPFPVRRERVKKSPRNAILGIDEDGKKEIFTLWMSGSNGESSLLWQEVLETLRERGLRKVLLNRREWPYRTKGDG